jgi:FkbM family methyltransferase
MYFVLAKPVDRHVDDDTQNSIVRLKGNIHILPRNNLGYYLDHGLFEKHLIEWCKQFCTLNRTFLDIGAHTGTYAVSLADHCAHVYAFEPQKMTYYALCGSVALSDIDKITCYNVGLGSEEQVGKRVLNIVSLDGGGSSLHATQPPLSTELVEIRTLDSFNVGHVGFIKMDVEENELQVLQGAQETIRKFKPKILFESNHYNEILFEYIRKIGYTIVPVSGTGNMYLAT